MSKYETIEQGARAHGLRIEPILAALEAARRSGSVPPIAEADRQPARRAPGVVRGAREDRAHRAGHVGKRRRRKIAGHRDARDRAAPQALRVGILDADITGPSIPKLFGLHEPLSITADPVKTTPQGQPQPLIAPAISRSAIEIVSSNLLTDREDTAMIWRGPIVAGVIRQFYEQVLWSDLDFLLVDLPPGTSDAPLTVLQSLSIDGVVLVTMPQALATMVVRKAANLVHQLKKPILGIVENMSYFVAPDTGARYEIFGPSYAQRVAELAQARCWRAFRSIRQGAPRRRRPHRGARRPDLRRLAERLLDELAARPKPKETISIV